VTVLSLLRPKSQRQHWMRLKAKVVGCELSRRSRTVAKELLDLQSSEIVIPIHSFPRLNKLQTLVTLKRLMDILVATARTENVLLWITCVVLSISLCTNGNLLCCMVIELNSLQAQTNCVC